MTSNRIIKAISLGLLLAGARWAAAADGKIYPGALCTPDTWNLTTQRLSNGSIYVTQQRNLWCPIIGDSEASPSTGLSRVRIYINESSMAPAAGEAANTVCKISSMTGLGVPHESNQAEKGTGNGTLDIPLNRNDGPLNARYLLQCTLTRDSKIFEYEIEER